MVYIREAHAVDSRSPMMHGPLVEDPVNNKERHTVAQRCSTALELAEIPTLVDKVDDKVGLAYAAWPDRLYLVGVDGKIAYAGGRGPFGFHPKELAAAIEVELKKQAAKATTSKPGKK